jgi:hypothetical protein
MSLWGNVVSKEGMLGMCGRASLFVVFPAIRTGGICSEGQEGRGCSEST